MKNKNLGPIFVQSIFALTVFAAVTYAQTITPLPARQAAEAASSLEIGQSAVTTVTKDSSAPTAGRLFVVRPNDRLQLDLRTRKAKTAESTLDRKTSAVACVEAEPESEAPDPQAAKPAVPASNGTNPAELITRMEVKYQYQNFAAGDLHGIAIIRGDYAFTPKIAFRMDLPILHFDSKTPGLSSESGIGDIVTSMTFVKIFSRRFVGAVVPRIDFPTATHDSLGSGKYAFKPVVAGVTPLAKGVALVGVLEYRVSFAGNKTRADINELSIKPILLKSFLEGPLKGYYVNPQAEVIVDFEHNNQATLQLAANIGKVLSKNVVVFVVPTIHVAGTKRESFKLEVGFRYLFR
jgi:hypothetical protein